MNIKEAAAAMGSIGGKNGTGPSKRRSNDHYRRMAMIRWKKPPAERFWGKVEKRGEDECWTWTGFRDSDGYGNFSIKKKIFKAHRMAYQFHYGIEVKNFILHRCDNPSCCNPNHLFEGTQLDNMRDMIKKGRKRTVEGENQPTHKLTSEDVIQIRTDTRVNRIIGREYGITNSVISRVKNRKLWKHVP